METTRQFKEAVGSIIRQRRQSMLLTQIELGLKTGVSQRRISDTENGRWDQIEALSELFGALKITMAWVIDRLHEEG